MATPSEDYSCLDIDNFNEVSLACEPICSLWDKLAKYLNISRYTVEAIRSTEGKTVEWCLDELLTAWLRRPSPTQPKPCWRLLCNAVSHIDGTLSEKIRRDHPCGCCLCKGSRDTPVAKAVQSNDVQTAATELAKLFDELMDFLHKEIRHLDVDTIRFHVNKHFKDKQDEMNDSIEPHLSKIEDYKTPNAILNYFYRSNFIGYINYSLVKVFQALAKSLLLDKHIEEYEKDYQCFLELSLMQVHDAFQQCPDLCPDYPAGIPKFTIHLESEWEGKSVFELKEFLKQCFNNNDCIDQLMIAGITRNCIIVTFAVLPHITQTVLQYLTNDDVISTLKKEGITVDISKLLLQQKTIKMEPMEIPLKFETEQNLQDQPPVKPDWDVTTEIVENQLQMFKSMLFKLLQQQTVKMEEMETSSEAEQMLFQDQQPPLTGIPQDVATDTSEDSEGQLQMCKSMVSELDQIKDELLSLWTQLSVKYHEDSLVYEGEVVFRKRKLSDSENTSRAVKEKVDQSSNDKLNKELLMMAAKNNNEKDVQKLIDSRADVDTVDDKDWIPLVHIASAKSQQKTTEEMKGTMTTDSMEIPSELEIEQNLQDQPPPAGMLSLKPSLDVTTDTSGYSEGDTEGAGNQRLIDELKEDVSLKEAVDAYEYDRNRLKRQIKALEAHLQIQKRMEIDLDQTKNELQTTKVLLSGVQDKLNEHEKTLAEERKEIKFLQSKLLDKIQSQAGKLKQDLSKELFLAAERNNARRVETLIALEIDVDEENDKGWTPLYIASANGHSDIVNILLSHGATVDIKDNEGRTSLYMASRYGHSDVINILLSHRANVDIKSTLEGKTPLHTAARYNRDHVVRILLSHKATVDVVDMNLQTPLHRCLLNSSDNNVDATAELLISHGADLYQEDKFKQSPVLIATVLGKEHLLVSNGVSEDTIAKYRLPQGWKAEYKYPDRIKYTNAVTRSGVQHYYTHPLFQ